MKQSFLVLFIVILIFQLGCNPTTSSSNQAPSSPIQIKNPPALSIFQRIKKATSLDELVASLETRPADLSNINLGQIKMAIWKKYREEQLKNEIRQQEHHKKAIQFNGKTMKYEYQIKGEKPKNGYPLYIALHGGGSAPSSVNDSQWESMKWYYLNSVKNGIYLAPRGMTDTWNLHSVSEAYPSYDRLIENMILFENVDPNKVYLLGYSAGGDGVYQVVPRMADRFAAANMSAGHPNGIDLTNVYHVPFLIQVGELDRSYDRHTVSVSYGEKLADLQTATGNGYVHDTYVHWEKGHSYVQDHSGEASKSDIIANPSEWKNNVSKKIKTTKNTDAIHWMSQFERNPIPSTLIWDYKTKEKSRTGLSQNGAQLFSKTTRPNTFYWIACFEEIPTIKVPIKAAYDKAKNQVNIDNMGDQLTIFLNENMIDFRQKLNIHISEKNTTEQIEIKPSLRIMIETLQARGDYNYIFTGSLHIKKDENQTMYFSTNQ